MQRNLQKQPLISFIVPVYNAEQTIERCVNSLRLQTFSDIEILLVNNCSTDSSLQICKDLSKKDSRVLVLDIAENGVSVARNKGIDEASGKFISFVDADDWIDSNVCDIFVELNNKNHYDLFCFSAEYHKNDKTTRSYLFAKDVERLTQKQKEELQIKVFTPQAPGLSYKTETRYLGSSWGKIYKRELLLQKNLRFSKETVISEDVLFNTLSLDYFYNIGYTRGCFYHYEQRNDSAQNRYRPNSIAYFMYVIQQIQKWLVTTNKSQAYVDAANCLFVHYFFGTLKEDIFHKKNEQPLKNKIHHLKNVLDDPKCVDVLQKTNSDYFTIFEKMVIFFMKKKFVFLVAIVGFISSWF